MQRWMRALALALLTSALTAAHAQMPPRGGDADGSRVTEWMQTNLDLTEAQSTEVAKINADFAAKAQQIRTSETDRRARMQALRPVREAHDAALREVLDREQYARYEEKKKEQRARVRARRQQGSR